MTASKHLRLLSVRVPEPDLRRLKVTAATRGVKLQAAVQEAIGAWIAHPRGTSSQPLDAFEGSLADVDVRGLMLREREAELKSDRKKGRLAK